MSDTCEHCNYRGDFNKCLKSDCFQHKNWIVVQLQSEVQCLLRIKKASIAAIDYLPWHWPTHPKYESGISDAGRRLRIALWPDEYKACDSDIKFFKGENNG